MFTEPMLQSMIPERCMNTCVLDATMKAVSARVYTYHGVFVYHESCHGLQYSCSLSPLSNYSNIVCLFVCFYKQIIHAQWNSLKLGWTVAILFMFFNNKAKPSLLAKKKTVWCTTSLTSFVCLFVCLFVCFVCLFFK